MSELDTLENIVITERDLELFAFLNEQRAMVSGQIYECFWPDGSMRSGAGRKRLSKLVEYGYIKIVNAKIKDEPIKLFMLTDKGIEELKRRKLDHGFYELQDVHPSLLDHTLKVVNIRGVMRHLGGTKWKSERLIRKEEPARGWYPDGELELHGLKTAFELENSFKSKERYVERIKRYAMDKSYALVIFVVIWPYVRSWMLDLEMPQDKIGFMTYSNLIKDKGNAEIMNKSSTIKLGSLF